MSKRACYGLLVKVGPCFMTFKGHEMICTVKRWNVYRVRWESNGTDIFCNNKYLAALSLESAVETENYLPSSILRLGLCSGGGY